MATQAYVRTKSIVSYGSSHLNQGYDWEGLAYFLQNKFPMSYIYDEGIIRDNWEILREDLAELKEELKNKSKEELGYFIPNTNTTFGEFSNILSIWLDESSNADDFTNPEWVYIDWF